MVGDMLVTEVCIFLKQTLLIYQNKIISYLVQQLVKQENNNIYPDT